MVDLLCVREEDGTGNLAEVDDPSGVLVEHEVREALFSRWVEREALAPLLASRPHILLVLLFSGQAERVAERLRVVVEASLRRFRLDVLEVIRALCVLVEIVLFATLSGLLLVLEACILSESASDKSQFDLYCCACLRCCFGDVGIFPRILSGTCTARECPPLVAVVAVAVLVVAVVVLLLLCKLYDMISEDPVVIVTWCASGMHTSLVLASPVHVWR